MISGREEYRSYQGKGVSDGVSELVGVFDGTIAVKEGVSVILGVQEGVIVSEGVNVCDGVSEAG